MALKATICKAELNIADMDRGYYADHALTLAQHPSETDERLMLRLLAFACLAQEDLMFSKGLSEPDEPTLWRKDLTGDIDLWVDLGQPDDRRLIKACGRARQVVVMAYGSSVPLWWQSIASKLTRLNNLQILHLQQAGDDVLSDMAQKHMRLQCTIQDGQIWLTDGTRSIPVEVKALLSPR